MQLLFLRKSWDLGEGDVGNVFSVIGYSPCWVMPYWVGLVNALGEPIDGYEK